MLLLFNNWTWSMKYTLNKLDEIIKSNGIIFPQTML